MTCREPGGFVESSDERQNAATASIGCGDGVAALGMPKDLVPQR